MWRWNAWFVALVVLHEASIASTAIAAENNRHDSLLDEQRWASFEIVLGRITALHVRGGEVHKTSEGPDSGSRESLSANADPTPAMRYERVTAEQTILVQVLGTDEILIRKTSQSPSEPSVLFRQPATGDISLAIEQSAQKRQVTADTIWHLILTEPQDCTEHLFPLLAVLKPNWRLLSTAHRIEHELFVAAESMHPKSRREIIQLIIQLGSENFSIRQKADQQLRELGIAVLPYLKQFDFARLGGEQRLRIRQIRESMHPDIPDTPDRVVTWLGADRIIWVVMLDRFELWKREIAANMLKTIQPGAIRFDPDAEESHRREQIARIRSLLK